MTMMSDELEGLEDMFRDVQELVYQLGLDGEMDDEDKDK